MKTWDYSEDTIYDEDGEEAAERPQGMSDQAWDWTAGRIVLAMNALIEKEAK